MSDKAANKGTEFYINVDAVKRCGEVYVNTIDFEEYVEVKLSIPSWKRDITIQVPSFYKNILGCKGDNKIGLNKIKSLGLKFEILNTPETLSVHSNKELWEKHYKLYLVEIEIKLHTLKIYRRYTNDDHSEDALIVDLFRMTYVEDDWKFNLCLIS